MQGISVLAWVKKPYRYQYRYLYLKINILVSILVNSTKTFDIFESLQKKLSDYNLGNNWVATFYYLV